MTTTPATSNGLAAPDLTAAAGLVDLADRVIAGALAGLRDSGGPDAHQVFAYDIAHAGSAAATARTLLDYGAKGDAEAAIACAFAADMLHDLITRVAGREAMWGVDAGAFDAALPALGAYRDPEFVASL